MFVRVQTYPDKPAEIEVVKENSKGMSDEVLDELKALLVSSSRTLVGEEMIFNLVTLAKEFLTPRNKVCSLFVNGRRRWRELGRAGRELGEVGRDCLCLQAIHPPPPPLTPQLTRACSLCYRFTSK